MEEYGKAQLYKNLGSKKIRSGTYDAELNRKRDL